MIRFHLKDDVSFAQVESKRERATIMTAFEDVFISFNYSLRISLIPQIAFNSHSASRANATQSGGWAVV